MSPEQEKKQKLRDWALAVSQGDAPVQADEDLLQSAVAHILKTIPAPTMREIQWEEEKHKNALAYGKNCRVVMLRKLWPGDKISCLVLGSFQPRTIPVEELTPTGERYVLQTVDNQS